MAERLEILKKEDIHLVLMDIMMPEMDGITAMLKIREVSNVPVILLTAKSEDTDKVLGLTVGADDYVTKPFNTVELQARVKSQLRRYTQLGSTARSDNQSEFRTGGLVIRDDLKEVTVDGEKEIVAVLVGADKDKVTIATEEGTEKSFPLSDIAFVKLYLEF